MDQTTHSRSVNIGDGNSNSASITNSFNNLITVDKSDENAQIMCWLSPLEPNTRHQKIRAKRFDGVGDWLLETREWREWRGSDGGNDRAVLFCS